MPFLPIFIVISMYLIQMKMKTSFKNICYKKGEKVIVRITVAPVCGVTRFIPAAGSIEIVIRYHIVGGVIPVLHQLVDI